MPSDLRIAFVGDQFISARVLEEAARAALGRNFAGVHLDLPWPEVPFHSRKGPAGPEIAEYSGTPQDVAAVLQDADALLTHLAPVTAATLEAAPRLRFVGVTRGGPVNINMSAARERGVAVANVPGRNASAVAEFTVGAILSVTRRFTLGHSALAANDWRGDLYRFDRTGDELGDLTVGLLGYSHVGQRVARLLKPFGCRVLACDPYVPLNIYDEADGVEHVGLEELIARSDVLSLHARLTPQTSGIISRETMAAMKRGAVLINTARGELVDEPALIEALRSGHLGGAALDTFADEPLASNSPLQSLPNVTLTPHIAGASRRVATQAARMVAEDLRRHLDGVALKRPVA